jgi:hypothetical protein
VEFHPHRKGHPHLAASGVITVRFEVTMNTQEAKKTGEDIAKLVWASEVDQA